MAQGAQHGARDDLKGWDGGWVGGKLNREGIYVYVYMYTYS